MSNPTFSAREFLDTVIVSSDEPIESPAALLRAAFEFGFATGRTFVIGKPYIEGCYGGAVVEVKSVDVSFPKTLG